MPEFYRNTASLLLKKIPALSGYFLNAGGLTALLFGAATSEALVEAIDTTTAVQHFLFAGIKRMTLRAHIDVNVFTDGGACFDDVATAAGRCHIAIFGLDIMIH